MKTYLLIAAAAIAQSAVSMAQVAPAAAGFQQAQSLGTAVGAGIQWPAAMAGRWMSGKPYSAVAVTHTIQNLADGSQIEHSQSETVYRDEQGRTRTETNNTKFIRIVDPVANITYTLDTAAKTAMAQELLIGPGPKGASKQALARNPPARTPFEFAGEQAKHMPNLTVEDLGTQGVNGVQAQGARVTNTIPAGAIGNNRELKVISERWDSMDLGVQVRTVNTDPRFGTATYDLTNIVLGPQDPVLFRVPSDYAITTPPKRD